MAAQGNLVSMKFQIPIAINIPKTKYRNDVQHQVLPSNLKRAFFKKA
jgi:hypothetical protein